MIFEDAPSNGNRRLSMIGMFHVITASTELNEDELRELIANFAALAEFTPKSLALFKTGLSEVLTKSLERCGYDFPSEA